jgi:hypothetical protein
MRSFRRANYYNVKAGRQVMRGRAEREMGNAPDNGRRKECGFDLYGDDRVKGAVMRYRMDCNVTMSLSFNPANMVCEGCTKRGKHSLIGKEPMILVATDQNFPATLYSADEKSCIAVMRVEHGTMKEIGFAVADMLDGVEVPMGSIILVGSVSDLDSQGVSGYSEELARTMRILSEKIGNSVQVVAIPPVLLGGVNSPRLVRAIIETEFWAEGLEGSDNSFLSNTRRTVMEKIALHGVGRVEKPREEMHIVPRGVFSKDKVRFRSVGWTNVPVLVSPLSEDSEQDIVECLVKELRNNFGARVSSNLITGRGGVMVGREWEYLMVGGSNCGRLGDVLQKMGRKVTKVTSSGWRPSRKGVEDVVEKLDKLVMQVGKDAIVVFLGLDNGIFYEADEDGERSLPSKDKEGKYHVVGKLEVAGGRQAGNLMDNCVPIWEVVGDRKKAVLSPLVRYFRCTCCEAREHCVNMGMAGYRRGLLADLSDVKDAMLEGCQRAGARNFKVVNPNDLLGLSGSMEEDEVARIMGDDPVHLSEGGYVFLAEKLTAILEDESTAYLGGKREREQPLPEGDVIGSWERKKCSWLFFTVSKGKRESSGKQAGPGKSQGAGAGGSGYTGERERTGYGNRTWSAGDKYGVDKRSSGGYDR